jgi:hypothetical protein
MKCPNCSNEFDRNYCPSCGQKFLQTPYSFKDVVFWISDSFDFNRGFLITFYHLIVNPKRVINTYLNGNTTIYISPVKYFFLIIAAVFIITSLSKEQSLSGEEYLTYLISLVIVIYFWIVNIFLFRKSGLNTVEHLLIVIYESTEFILLIPMSLIISFALVGLGIVSEGAMNIILAFSWTGLILIYHIWFSVRVFTGKSFIIILKSLLTFLVAFVLTGFVLSQLG